MSVILHFSDPHFGTEQPPVVEALLRLAERVRPDVAILSGDITQRARPRQFAAARAFGERLGVSARVLIPGNHDIPFTLGARLRHPYRRYCDAFGADLEPIYQDAAVLIIGVNTTRWYRRKDGEVSAAQIERTCTRLREAGTRQLRLIVTHQPIHVIRARDEQNLLHGRGDAIPAWAAAGADLVLGGHIHLPYVRPLRDTYGLAREMWAVQAGTALSSRVRFGAPNSVNLIHHRPEAGNCTIERWDYAVDSGEFALVETVAIRVDRGIAAELTARAGR